MYVYGQDHMTSCDFFYVLDSVCTCIYIRTFLDVYRIFK